MTADLDTLLRDAGRGPTTDLDVDELHARGRRRAVARRLGAGAGVAAVIAAAGLGVLTVADRPEAPIVDQAPSPAPTPDAAPSEPAGPALSSVQLRDLGPSVALLRTSPDGTGGLHVLRVDDAGTVTATYGTAAGAVPPDWTRVVVDGQGRVVFVDQEAPDGTQTLLAFPIGEARPVVQRGPADNLGGVLGHDADGRAVLGTRVETERHVLLRVGDADLEELRVPDRVSLRDVGEAESHLVAVAPVGDDLLLLRGEGDSTTLERLTAGGAEVVLSVGPGTWLTDVAVLDGEVWLLEGSVTHTADGPGDATFDLLRIDLDSGRVERLPTPVGRGIDGVVPSMSAARTAIGPRLLLSLGADGGMLAPLVVDPTAAAAHLRGGPHSAEAEAPVDPYARLTEPDAGDGISGWGRLVVVP